MFTNFGNKNNSSKKKMDNSWLHFYYKLVFCWSLGGLGSCCCPLDSSLAGMGKVAKTSSWLWETTPPSEESLGVARGFVASGVTSLVFSFSFTAAPTCFAPFGGLLGGGRSWAGISWMEPGSWGQHHSKRLRSLVCGL